MRGSSKIGTYREHTGNYTADSMQAKANQIAKAADASPTFGSRLLDTEAGQPAGSGLVFVGGTVRTIAHGLNRKAKAFIELYGVDVPSAARVDLVPSTHPTGVTSDTHITVTPTNSGTCLVLVL